ncbi:MAG: ABC transporter permease [Microscillaceae bacterium]|nr:ABC transporter permease [Microscillaceae bacterium]
MILQLAWRNLWRNRRRSFITLSVIALSVALAVLMRSQQLGSYQTMLDNSLGSFLGHLQIQHPDYAQTPNLDNSFADADNLRQQLQQNPLVQAVVPRLLTYALLAHQDQSRAGLVVGIDPVLEKHLANPQKYLRQGRYFSTSSEEVVLGEDLARFLRLRLGDSLIILGQGYQGLQAAGKYLVVGILKAPSPELNRQMVFLPLPAAQALFGAEGQLTSLNVCCLHPSQSLPLARSLVLPKGEMVARPWQALSPELVQMIQSDDIGGRIIIGILYMVMSFGILGTMIMMTAERRYEFGVLLAIGMSRVRLALTVLSEMLGLALLGALLGCALMAPLIAYLYYHPMHLTGEAARAIEDLGFEPVINYAAESSIFWTQALLIFGITLLVAAYPVYKISRIKPVEAMRAF